MDEVTQQVRGIVTLDDRFSGKLAGMQRGLSKLNQYGGRALSNLSRNLERGLVVGAASAGYALKRTIEAAADFEDSMAAVSKTLTPLEREQLPRLSAELLELSKRLPVTAVELAAIAKQGGQLGVPIEQMDTFVETLAKLSKVTELDVTYAAENMGKLRTIFQFSEEEMANFADTLVRLENDASSTVEEILNVSRRFAAAGKAAGLSADQVAAFASVVTSVGVLPEAGGSALSRIFNRTGVEFANASKKAKEFAKFMNMPFEQAKKLLAEDPAKYFTTFFERLNKIFTEGTPLERLEAGSLLKALGFNNVRDVNTIQLFSQGVEELRRQMGLATSEGNELDDAATARFKSFANQYQLFKNKITALQISVGTKLFPALIKGMDTLSTWFDKNGDKIAAFGDELAKEFSKFMENLTPENLDRLAGALSTAYDWAKRIVGVFMGLPEPIRNLLIGLYVGNKLTGGVVADLVGELGKGLIRGVLGINAGVVHLKAGVVYGSGLPGGAGGGGVLAGGAGGGLKGAAKGALKLGLLGGLLTVLTGGIEEKYKPTFKRGEGPLGPRTNAPVPVLDPATKEAVTKVQVAVDQTKQAFNVVSKASQAAVLEAFQNRQAALQRQMESEDAAAETYRRRQRAIEEAQAAALKSIRLFGGNAITEQKKQQGIGKAGNSLASKVNVKLGVANSKLQTVANRITSIANRPIQTNTNVRATINVNIDGKTLATTTWQSSSSSKTTIRGTGSTGGSGNIPL